MTVVLQHTISTGTIGWKGGRGWTRLGKDCWTWDAPANWGITGCSQTGYAQLGRDTMHCDLLISTVFNTHREKKTKLN